MHGSVFFLILFLLSNAMVSSHASVAICEHTYGYGPLKIQPAADNTLSPFYQSARQLASRFGRQYTSLVSSHLSEKGKTTLVVAMGGAEHLGTLLELSLADFIRDQRIEIKYIPLGRDIVRPWRASKLGASPSLERVGIGTVPPGYVLTADPSTLKIENGSNPQALKEYLKPWQIFDSEKLLVIDTGNRGSIPEAIFQVAKLAGYSKTVEGILLYQTYGIETDVKIFPLNIAVQGSRLDLNFWASAVDYNSAGGRNDGRITAFARSSSVADDDEARIHYQETLQGLKDGLAQPGVY